MDRYRSRSPAANAHHVLFRVESATSEDAPLHTTNELNPHAVVSHGWQSERFCKYPQVLVLALEGRPALSTITLQAHRFMIASRVELFVGSNSSSSSGGAPHFTYICECLFDTNMQSGHQMQETKTLHLNADAKRATHLQLVLHRCRENDHNICYQVGLASVRLHEHERMHKRLASSVEAFPKPMDPEFEAMLWPQMVRKQRAVAAEAFDEAKDALANIRALRAAGSELAEMERRQHALAAVDRFDEARRLQLLTWCTALTALPVGGLRENKIRLRLYGPEEDDRTLPETHTCTRELHLPNYTSAATLRSKLLLALEHATDGFQKE